MLSSLFLFTLCVVIVKRPLKVNKTDKITDNLIDFSLENFSVLGY